MQLRLVEKHACYDRRSKWWGMQEQWDNQMVRRLWRRFVTAQGHGQARPGLGTDSILACWQRPLLRRRNETSVCATVAFTKRDSDRERKRKRGRMLQPHYIHCTSVLAASSRVTPASKVNQTGTIRLIKHASPWRAFSSGSQICFPRAPADVMATDKKRMGDPCVSPPPVCVPWTVGNNHLTLISCW